MICKKCGIELTSENARKRKNVPSGFRPICNPCRNTYERSRVPEKQCEECNIWCKAKGKRSFCSELCRFLAYFEKDNKTKCWNWVSKIDQCGYGIFIKGKDPVRAHRYSYEFFKGPIVGELYVCHACDNRRCVNPSHLWIGTNQENQQDRFKKKFRV